MDLTPEELDALVADLYPAAGADGLRCESLGERKAVVRWPLDETQLRPGGYISGPVQFRAADMALWYAVFTVIGVEPMAVTTHLHITFLRPAVGGDLLARCRILRVGRTRIYGDVDLWVEGKPDELVAHAVGGYSNLDRLTAVGYPNPRNSGTAEPGVGVVSWARTHVRQGLGGS